MALLGAVLCRLRLRRSLFCLLGNLLRSGGKPLETCVSDNRVQADHKHNHHSNMETSHTSLR